MVIKYSCVRVKIDSICLLTRETFSLLLVHINKNQQLLHITWYTRTGTVNRIHIKYKHKIHWQDSKMF